ncbi:MAG: hypothetical protein ACXWW4_18195 [Candidatus Binatia bacterium]|jgi:hypothetical protein
MAGNSARQLGHFRQTGILARELPVVSRLLAILLPLCLDFAHGILIASLSSMIEAQFRKYH